MKHGFLLIDKPIGPTSHDVVDMVRKNLHEAKAGHLGTLDPFASGLLVVAVGAKALKVIEFFNELHKEYEAIVKFGSVSTTYDSTGVIEEVPMKPGVSQPDLLQLRTIIHDRFTGSVEQIPPPYSAVHIGGQRAYMLARKGVAVNIPSRTVEISSCDIVSYEYPTLTLKVACGSGTYIRSLAHDLGQLMHTAAYLDCLRRTKVGEWKIEDAKLPKDIDWTDVIPLKEVMKSFPSIELDDAQSADIKLGKKIPLEIKPDTVAWNEGLPIAILVPSKDGSRTAHARKVL